MSTFKSFMLLTIALFIFIQCQQKEPAFPSLIKQRSWSEVLSISERYGFDSLSLPIEKNNAYLYVSSEELEQALKDRQQSRESWWEHLIFMEKNAEVRSFEDYENLINSLPHYRITHVKSYETPAEYEKYLAKMRTVKWHIYRSEKGVIRFMRPENDRGYYEGEERIDNKPRAK